MALFQKQVNCPSDKAITMCGTTDRTMRLMPVRHNRIGTFAENKLRLVPTTMCRRTVIQDKKVLGIHRLLLMKQLYRPPNNKNFRIRLFCVNFVSAQQTTVTIRISRIIPYHGSKKVCCFIKSNRNNSIMIL